MCSKRMLKAKKTSWKHSHGSIINGIDNIYTVWLECQNIHASHKPEMRVWWSIAWASWQYFLVISTFFTNIMRYYWRPIGMLNATNWQMQVSFEERCPPLNLSAPTTESHKLSVKFGKHYTPTCWRCNWNKVSADQKATSSTSPQQKEILNYLARLLQDTAERALLQFQSRKQRRIPPWLLFVQKAVKVEGQ